MKLRYYCLKTRNSPQSCHYCNLNLLKLSPMTIHPLKHSLLPLPRQDNRNLTYSNSKGGRYIYLPRLSYISFDPSPPFPLAIDFSQNHPLTGKIFLGVFVPDPRFAVQRKF